MAETAEIVERIVDNKDQKFYSPSGESTITLRYSRDQDPFHDFLKGYYFQGRPELSGCR